MSLLNTAIQKHREGNPVDIAAALLSDILSANEDAPRIAVDAALAARMVSVMCAIRHTHRV